MSTSATVPMISPDGVPGDVPAERVHEAVAQGFKVGVNMLDPESGKPGVVPAERYQEAAKAGFKVIPFQAPDVPAHPAYYGFTPGNIAASAWQGVKDVAGGAMALGKDLYTNPNWFTGPDSTLQKFVFAPADVEAQKAKDLWSQGRYSEAIGHGLAAGIPMIGPAAAQIGEQIGAGDVGGGIARGGAQALTPMAVSRGLGAVAPLARRGLLLGYTPEQAYGSALKPSTTMPPETRAAIVRTGLEERIPVTRGGIEKIAGLLDNLNQQIAAQIQTDPNAPISRAAVAARTVPGPMAMQVNPVADLEAIARSKQEFLRQDFPGSRGERPGIPAVPPRPTGLLDPFGNPVMTRGTPAIPPVPAEPLPAEVAQRLKQGTYAQLGSKAYGEMKTADVEAQKSLARGLKEEIAQAFPEIADLNAREARLYDLQPAIERAVNRISNHQLLGIGTPIAAGAASVLTGSGKLGAAAGALKLVLDNPAVKSRLAIALSKGGRIPPATAAARIADYANALQSSAIRGTGLAGASQQTNNGIPVIPRAPTGIGLQFNRPGQ